MDALNLAQNAYAAPSAPSRTARDVEYEAFAKVTGRLARANAARGTDFPAFAAALHDNSRLWTALAADVAEPANGLPTDLRAALFDLAGFARRHTRRVLTGEADAGVLIDINKAVMRGLHDRKAGT